jgi:iron complex outermembrane receptor protein/outer membrane receptor for ferrienterochelin and colicins
LPIGDNIKAEISSGYNAEVNYKLNWDEESSLFINQAFFLTSINNPVIAQENTSGLLSFYNASKPILSKGLDTYMKLKMFDWELYAGLTYTIAERKYLDSKQFMPVTPKFRMAYMLTREWEGKGRFCVEASYNGSQFREDGTTTPGYLFMAAMAEVKLNDHLKLILNGENLLDYRQSKVESLYDGTLSNPSFKALWAPIDGRVMNLCLKFSL